MYLFWCEITAPPVLIKAPISKQTPLGWVRAGKKIQQPLYSLLLRTGGEGCVGEGAGEISDSHSILSQPTLLHLQLLQSWTKNPSLLQQ